MAAEGLDEGDVEGQGAALQVGDGAALIKQALFSDQKGRVVGQAAVVTHLGQLVGFLIGVERFLRSCQPGGQGALARQGVGDLLHGGQDVLVVAGDGQGVFGLGRLQVGVQASAVEDRQAERRPDIAEVRTALEQVAGAECLETDGGGQVDIGIEGGVGDLDIG